jgi:hypothetical protein
MVVAILFFVLTWLTVGLRVYVRSYMLKTWGRDDWYMVVSLVIYFLQNACFRRMQYSHAMLTGPGHFHHISRFPSNGSRIRNRPAQMGTQRP